MTTASPDALTFGLFEQARRSLLTYQWRPASLSPREMFFRHLPVHLRNPHPLWIRRWATAHRVLGGLGWSSRQWKRAGLREARRLWRERVHEPYWEEAIRRLEGRVRGIVAAGERLRRAHADLAGELARQTFLTRTDPLDPPPRS